MLPLELPSFLVYPSSKTTRKLKAAVKPIKVAYLHELQIRCSELFGGLLQKKEKLIDIIIPSSNIRELLNKYVSAKHSGAIGYFVSIQPEGSVQKRFGIIIPGPTKPMWTVFYINVKKLNGSFDTDTCFKLLPSEYIQDSHSLILNHCDLTASSKKFFEEVFSNNPSNVSEPYSASFSMKLPKANLDSRDTKLLEDSLKTIDPGEYLANSYFSTLYEERIPLPFFPKSTLPRIHVLAHSNTKLVKECITKFLITSMSFFDKRHIFVQIINDDEFDLEHFKSKWMDLNSMLHPSELEFRREFFDSICSDSASFNRDKVSSLLTKLKIKEAKLQVLLLLEILHILNQDGSSNTSDKPHEKKPDITKKRVKIRKRNRSHLVGHKKRLLPTFIGTVIPVNTHFSTDLRSLNSSKNSELPLDVKKVKLLIRNWFDRLCVWEAVLGISEKSEGSSFSFLKSAVIPFYAKKHHRLLKELVTRSRGLKLDNKKNKSTKLRQHSVDHKMDESDKMSTSDYKQGLITDNPNQFLSRDNNIHPSERQHRKNLQTGRYIPHLARRASSLAGLKDLKINRNHSFAAHEDFSRKTFEMVRSTSFSQMIRHSSQNLKETLAKRTISLHEKIFDHRKKRRLVAPKTKFKETASPAKEVTEIEATPLKKRRHLLKVRKESQLKPVPEISVHSSSPIIGATPIKLSKEPNVEENIVINSSPMDSSPLNLLHSQHDISMTSPLKNSIIMSESSTQNIDESLGQDVDKQRTCSEGHIENQNENQNENHDHSEDGSFSTLFSSPLRPIRGETQRIDDVENNHEELKEEEGSKNLERFLHPKPTRRRLQFD